MIQSTPVTGGRGYSQRPPHGRRDRLFRHLVPVLLVGALAFVVGVVVGAFHTPAEQAADKDRAAEREYRCVWRP